LNQIIHKLIRQLTLVVLLIASTFCYGQPFLFKKNIGDPYPNNETSLAVINAGNNYLSAGYNGIGSTNNWQMQLSSIDLFGNLIWNSTINYNAAAQINPENLLLYDSNSIYVCGEYWNYADTGSVALLKFDALGNLLWNKIISDSMTQIGPFNLKKLADGNLLVVGWKTDTITNATMGHVIKTDTAGNAIWSKDYIGTYLSSFTSILEKENGKILLAGKREFSLNGGRSWLVTIDSIGNLIKDTSYFVGTSSVINVYQSANSIDSTENSGFILAGHLGISPNYRRGLIIKLDSSYHVQWYNMISQYADGSGNLFESDLTDIRSLPDGSFICSGSIKTGPQQLFRMLLLKLDASGNELWRRYFSGTNGYNSYGFSMDLTGDGGFILSGRAEDSTNADILLVRTNCLGFIANPHADFSVTWNGNDATFYNTSVRADTCIYYFGDGDSALVLLTDTVPILHQYSGSGPWQAYLLAFACGEIDTIYQTITTGIELLDGFYESTFSVYPNPSSEQITISYQLPQTSTKAEIEIYDLSGKIILSYTCNPLARNLELNISELSAGSYVAAMVVDGKIRVREKVVVVR
jgi:hypothetical protein